MIFSCSDEKIRTDSFSSSLTDSALYYLNLSDTARYVGMAACRQCHENIYRTFIHTGMGKSWKKAKRNLSAAVVFPGFASDRKLFLEYEMHVGDSGWLVMKEKSCSSFLKFSNEIPVSFIVGSGQHTNSHLLWKNGYLWQMPMTWYSQKKNWDLPPGFEMVNSRFSRPIGHECITCHNAYPQPVPGSENKYRYVPEGIDCERCHGPGSIHVAMKKNGQWIDTAKFVDRSIVNPAKLPVPLQMDICQRCHLQGNAVLREGKSFYDFRPGMKLSDVMYLFLPRFSDSKENFIMASHADRLKQSACFIKSNSRALASDLKPFRRGMTCVTCHNPHVSVQKTSREHFNQKCLSCHAYGSQAGSLSHKTCPKKNIAQTSDCISCHMPKSTSTDIPHVTIHDHFIRKPLPSEEVQKIKKFLGLVCINHPSPDSVIRALAFIQQYEKFENRPEFLDSAFVLLSYASKNELLRKFHALVYYYFVKKEFIRITEIIRTLGFYNVLELLSGVGYSNRDAWTAYRIGEALYQCNDVKNCLDFYRKAHELAPYISSFHAKYAFALMINQKTMESIREYESLIKENPMHAEAYSNLGFIYLSMHQMEKSKSMLDKAFSLSPQDDGILLNIAAWHATNKDYDIALSFVGHLLALYPSHKKGIKVKEFLLREIQKNK